jgi:hypothetical protein
LVSEVSSFFGLFAQKEEQSDKKKTRSCLPFFFQETFNKAAVDATDYEESLDWENRRKWIDERAGKKKKGLSS